MEIKSVSIKVEPDENPDLSYLGEFKREREPGAIPTNLGERYMQWFVPCNSGEDARQWYREHGWPKHAAWLKGQQRAREVMARANDYGEGWHMVGIWAEAEIVVEGVIQEIRSGGLWGIESDSDSSYFEEVAKEELHALGEVLKAMGFGPDPLGGFDLDELAEEAGDKGSVTQELEDVAA
jgi:hypothetical protein